MFRGRLKNALLQNPIVKAKMADKTLDDKKLDQLMAYAEKQHMPVLALDRHRLAKTTDMIEMLKIVALTALQNDEPWEHSSQSLQNQLNDRARVCIKSN